MTCKYIYSISISNDDSNTCTYPYIVSYSYIVTLFPDSGMRGVKRITFDKAASSILSSCVSSLSFSIILTPYCIIIRFVALNLISCFLAQDWLIHFFSDTLQPSNKASGSV